MAFKRILEKHKVHGGQENEWMKIINADKFISGEKGLLLEIIKGTAFNFMFVCWHSNGF